MIAVATAAAGNYLPMARVMAESCRGHHPDVPVLFALCDDLEDRLRTQEPFDVVPLDDLALPDLKRFCFGYRRLEAAIAIKPFVLERALDLGFDAVLYIDVDVLVLGDISGLLREVRAQGITLVPHLLEPLTGTDRIARELNILQSGVFNGGVLGLSEAAETRAFLGWWKERVYEDCRHAVGEGLHYDQRWLDLVPSFFEDVHLYEDPAVNVAHWNLAERDLATCRLFHFSGYDPDRPDVFTRYSDRASFDEMTDAAPLFRRYRDAVLAAGWREAQERPYAYDYFDNGERIADSDRSAYRGLGDEASRFGDPFRTDGPDTFYSRRRTAASTAVV